MVLWSLMVFNGLMVLWSFMVSYGLAAVLCLNDNDDFYFVWGLTTYYCAAKAAAVEQLQFCEKGLHLLTVNLKVE